MLPSPRFSVASAFVPHLCFLSLLCYVRILLAPFHRPFSLLSLLTPFLCLLGVLFCSVFLISLIYSVTSVLFEFPCFPCDLCLSAFSLYSVFSVFSPIFIFPQTLPCALKRFPLTTSRKTTTTCAENVLTLTPECFHRHVFLLPLHSSLISAFSLYSVTSAFYSPHFIVPFLCLLGVLFCSVFSDFPHLLCYLCFFRISLFSLRPLSLCFLSLLCFLSDFPISPDPPVRAKTFSAHNKPKNNHDVRGKRFNAHAGPR